MFQPDPTAVRLVDLGTRLLRQTATGRIAWKRTDRRNCFMYAGSAGSVTIEDSAMVPSYTLRVHDRTGNQAEFLQARVEAVGSRDVPVEAYSTLQQLFVAAQRSAGRGNELIDDLIAEIG